MLRFFTAGETHGKALVAIIEGMPSGVKINLDKINAVLAQRQRGYGRGERMAIEADKAEILSGIRNGYTLGSPITIKIENKDWLNWSDVMGTESSNGEKNIECPRPGHADLTGGMKYNHRDMRNVLERASARETAVRTAVGALTSQLLEPFGVKFFRRVVSIGDINDIQNGENFYERVYASPVGFGDKKQEEKAIEHIENAKKAGESVGGIVEVRVDNLPPGLGSYAHYDRRLDANIALAVMSIQAIKGVEFGMGFEASKNVGSSVHDSIFYDDGYFRKTNNAGGIEGGMTNGEPLIVRAAMKPIPTLYNPLDTVNINTKKAVKASVERSDICAVPACSVVAKAAVEFEIAKAFLDKFNGDCIEDVKSYYNSYIDRIKEF